MVESRTGSSEVHGLPGLGGVMWSKCWWKLLVVLIIAIPIKQSWESDLNAQARQQNFLSTNVSNNVRSSISQGAAIALLSGFRGLVADFTWLAAHNNWEKKEWFRMRPKLDAVVLLEPHFLDYWDIGAWHMAWNISYDVSVDSKKEPREAFRLKDQRHWIEEGEKFLREGIQNNPESWLLYFKLGWLLDQKEQEFEKAAEYFKKAAEFPEAPLYVRRQVGHSLTKAGKKREALEWWKKIWNEPRTEQNKIELWDRIEDWIRELEVELKVPQSERTFPAEKTSNSGRQNPSKTRKKR